MPHGGLFLWVKLPSGDAREFAQFAVRHGVVTLPGSTLSADESHTAFLRLPFLAEPETLRRGVDRLATAWRLFQSPPGRTAAQASRFCSESGEQHAGTHVRTEGGSHAHEHVARRTISARSTQHAARSTCYAFGTNLYPGSRC